MIHIASTIHGIEVAGYRHPLQTVRYHDDQFTADELAKLQASEYLTVEIDPQPDQPEKPAESVEQPAESAKKGK